MDDHLWMIQTNIDEPDFDYDIAYGLEPGLFSIKIHHGGMFVLDPKRDYINGSVSFVDCCDVDVFDADLLEEMVKSIGYPPDMVFYFHFKLHGKSIDDGLRHIANPNVISLLLTTVRSGVKLVEIYVEHWHSRILSGFLGDDVCGPDDDLDNGDDDEFVDGENLEDGEMEDDLDNGDEFVDEANNIVDDFVVEDVEVDLEGFKHRMGSKNVNVDDLDVNEYDDGIDPIDMQHFSSNSEDEEQTTALKTCMRRIRKEQRKKSNTVSEECPFYIGQKIDDKAILKDLIKKLALKTRRQLFIAKNDKVRFRVVCIGGSVEGSKMYEWLSKIPAASWSRAHFTGRAQSDILLNNLCEVFNKQLVGARDKPIYTCLEYIRTYMQKRIVNMNKVISKCVGPLTPAATKLFTKIKDDASQYVALLHGPNKYQVNGPWSDQVVVDMDAKTCTCRRWDLTGMPCRHVVCVIWDMANNKLGSGVAENFVSKVFWLETWKEAYSMNISPISGREHWLPSRCPTSLIPPKHHTPIGRPKKARRRAFDETHKSVAVNGRLTRKGATVTYSKCGKQGHNQRGCKGQGGESSKKRSRESSSVIELSQGAPMMSQDHV